MTDLALKKLESQLQCSICLDQFKDPRLLQCCHIFCKDCVSKLVMEEQQGMVSLSCPTCRHSMTLPSNGVDELRPASHINQLQEIREDLLSYDLSMTDSQVKGGGGGGGGGRKEENGRRKKKDLLYCAQHKGKEMELLCESCNELACLKCAMKGGRHYSHNYSFLGDDSERYRSEILAALDPVQQKVNAIKKSASQIEKRSDDLVKQRKNLEAAIEDAVAKIHVSVNRRKTELLSMLHQLTDDKLALLASQRKGLESNYFHLTNCLDFVNAGLETGSPVKVIQMKAKVSSLVDSLMESIGSEITDPVTEADIKFTGPLEIHNDAFRTFGGIYAFGSCDVTKTRASGSGLTSATVGEDSKVFIHPVNFLGQPCNEPISNLRCELVSNLNGTKVKGSVEKTKSDGRIELRYRPVVQGRHHLHVVIDNQPIPGSPFSVAVDLKNQNLAFAVLNMKGAERPWGLTVSVKEDEVIVSDSEKHCVSIFSRSLGGILRSFGTSGSGQGCFRSPRGIALDKNSNMFVVDSENHRIQKFTLDGKFIASVGSMGNGPLLFYYPKDIAYNPANDRLYILDGNDQVQILNSEFSLCAIFGKHGRGKGQFHNPWGIACDSSGRVYIADTYNHRIQIFTAEKEFITTFGVRGNRDGELMDPISIAVDSPKGVVYVSERQAERVSMFTTEGVFLSASTGGGFKCGLAVDGDGLVYVCNTSKCEIQVY